MTKRSIGLKELAVKIIQDDLDGKFFLVYFIAVRSIFSHSQDIKVYAERKDYEWPQARQTSGWPWPASWA
jgi:AAA+ ATPase superfamily predicted ATPase